MPEHLIKDITPSSPLKRRVRRWVLNKYFTTIVAFLVWMVFFDSTSFLVINELNQEIKKYEQQLAHFKGEYEKSTAFYNKLMKNKDEKEKYARENYFMKKPNEEIFILVVDSSLVQAKETGKPLND